MDSYFYTTNDYVPYSQRELGDYYNPLFQILLAIVLGIILSPFSLGFFFFIIIYIICELYYVYLRGFKYTLDEMAYRALMFLCGLLGFLFGRAYIGDNDPFRMHYDEWEL